MGLTEVDHTIMHNIPVLIAAEYGVPVGALFTPWLGLLGLAALFTSARATAVFVAILPYVYFDNLHMVYINGTVGLGLWSAVMDYHRLRKNHSSELVEEPAETATPAIAWRTGIRSGARGLGGSRRGRPDATNRSASGCRATTRYVSALWERVSVRSVGASAIRGQ